MTRHHKHALVLAALLLIVALPVNADTPVGCEPEPASQWAPAGFVCPPRYGIGTASTWGGPGAATNSCSWIVRHSTGCPPIAIRSLETGVQIIVTPSEYCMCWVGVTGPNGETERLVDLSPELVAALGLPGPGLFPVEVQQVSVHGPEPFREGIGLPDTAVRP